MKWLLESTYYHQFYDKRISIPHQADLFNNPYKALGQNLKNLFSLNIYRIWSNLVSQSGSNTTIRYIDIILLQYIVKIVAYLLESNTYESWLWIKKQPCLFLIVKYLQATFCWQQDDSRQLANISKLTGSSTRSQEKNDIFMTKPLYFCLIIICPTFVCAWDWSSE